MIVQEVSVLKIGDLLVVTVPSDPGDDTIASLQEKVLAAMEKHQAKGLVLDIATVDTLDSYFARVVAETVQMVALMGGETVISGMSASVAITATQLGLTLGDAKTALDLDRALTMLRNPFGESQVERMVKWNR